jgi:hypothetical protein
MKAKTESVQTSLPVIVTSSGTRHAVWANGGATDGSLYGSYTLCGLAVRLFWREAQLRKVTCGRCQRSLALLRAGGEPRA